MTSKSATPKAGGQGGPPASGQPPSQSPKTVQPVEPKLYPAHVHAAYVRVHPVEFQLVSPITPQSVMDDRGEGQQHHT